MKVINAYATVLLVFSVLFGCHKHDVSASYTGDGELINLKKGFFDAAGWKVSFEEFRLSEEYTNTYVFSGLPALKGWEWYSLSFRVPASIEISSFEDVVLHIELHADGKFVSKYKAPMSEWNWGQTYRKDGAFTMFYGPDLRVPANPDVKYTLNVEYDPNGFTSPEAGCFFLQVGGRK